ncbi:MAG: sodium-dependent transporter [Ruminococcaceae bacterium]|nr:sodium-dependent transporter [Oscillospiraceae bacterium]
MEKKTKWASNVGFLLASAGSAIGLGNLWKFPYLMGENGGFWFLIVYIIFILILGLPVMISELSIGRMTESGPVKAFGKLNKKFKFIGIIGISCAFIILSYYSVIGGWIFKYIENYIVFQAPPADFSQYIATSAGPVFWHFIFIAITALVCCYGTKGIERASKVMMPVLFIMLIVIAIRSLTLGAADKGLAFMFTAKGGFSLNTIVAALGQVFYSLSLCMGITITYGSYLSKKESIPKNVTIIASLDTSIALLAGLAIFPAVFAFGLEPSQGTTLTFGTLPKVFESMQGGWIFAIIFFLLMAFAALTSAIALLECVVSAILDRFNCSRKIATIFTALGAFLLGIPAALTYGVLKNFKILNYDFFDFLGVITDNILMPVGGIFMCIFIGWIWGPKHIAEHVETNSNRFPLKKAWLICIRFIVPILIVLVTIVGFINIFNIVTK